MRSRDTQTHVHHNHHLLEKAEGGIDNIMLLLAVLIAAAMGVGLIAAANGATLPI